MQEYTSMEEVLEVVAVEQMLNSLPAGMRVWVCRRKLRTVAEVGRLVDDFTQARGQTVAEKQLQKGEKPKNRQRQQCHNCGLI